ncbi:calcium-binding protein [Albimonas sp. CAU 1670]|uniref:calcium-binding protein n=1 Tax=Albimonas sp. CAU 1670 TaxID=3032599 RepID=UPI0023DB821A|nr:calcium-binding protein [Albimonas sp. CAU 1670]MDF2232234.1 calcium-binding protein [Albimonas sp. CAU 1670]
MAFYYTGSSTTQYVASSNASTYFTQAGETISISGFVNAFLFANTAGAVYVLAGTAISEDADAVGAIGSTSDLYVHVLSTGAALGDSDGVELSGIGARIVNHGLISGNNDSGAQLLDAGGVLENHGTVTGERGAVTSDDGRIENHGSITGRDGIGASFNDRGYLLNTGTIVGNTSGVTGGGSEGGLTVMNSGTIASSEAAFYSAVQGSTGDDTVINTGVLLGGVNLRQSFDLLRNHGGEVQGDVDMGEAADTVLNRDGAIYGDVDLGSGNDLYRGGRGSVVEGRIIAGDDNDTVVGGDGEDTVEGGGGFDLIKGKGGDDVLKGGAGLDTIVGGGGDDEMTGGSLSDLFRVGKHSGDDVITDFENEVDVVDLRKLSITGSGKVAQVQAAAHDVDGGSIIDLDALGGDGSLELQGLAVSQYGGAEFLF